MGCQCPDPACPGATLAPNRHTYIPLHASHPKAHNLVLVERIGSLVDEGLSADEILQSLEGVDTEVDFQGATLSQFVRQQVGRRQLARVHSAGKEGKRASRK